MLRSANKILQNQPFSNSRSWVSFPEMSAGIFNRESIRVRLTITVKFRLGGWKQPSETSALN